MYKILIQLGNCAVWGRRKNCTKSYNKKFRPEKSILDESIVKQYLK